MKNNPACGSEKAQSILPMGRVKKQNGSRGTRMTSRINDLVYKHEQIEAHVTCDCVCVCGFVCVRVRCLSRF